MRPCPARALLPALMIFLAIAPLAASVYLVPSLRDVSLAGASTASRVAELEVTPTTFAIIMVVAVIQTGLAEELLFRGFLAKRLIAWLGFQRGNAAQTAIFLAPHLLLFAGAQGAAFGPTGLLIVMGTAGATGWLCGWVNERRGDGSIIPGWLVHSAANMLAYTLVLLL